jgi:predicted unusual protein kinase regulating ubiquinone biosynthesis (AarF/ABC1/UbiB family)
MVERVAVVAREFAGAASRTPLARNMRVAQTVVELQSRLPSLTTPTRRAATGEWLAERLEELGATYIKVGQFIASRSDVYGPEFSSAFVGMHDRVSPVRGEASRELVSAAVDLSLFQSIEFEAGSAASIAQVHRGRLVDGRAVVVKVVRPGVRESVRADMVFLESIASALVRAADAIDLSPGTKAAARQALDTVRDLSGYLAEELDLRAEARNLDRFGRMYPPDHAEVRVPRIVKEACGPDAVVMEYVPSVAVSEMHACGTTPANRAASARSIMIVFIRQLLSNGVVHGDPHVGNMGVDARGRLVMYDFGSVVRLDREDVCHLKDLVSFLVLGDTRRAVSVLRRMGADVLDERALEAYVGDYREYMRTLDFRAMAASAAARAASAASSSSTSSSSASSSPPYGASTVPIVLPGRISRIVRSFALLEGVCKAIDPGFNYFDTIAEAATKVPLELVFDVDYLTYKLRHDVAAI